MVEPDLNSKIKRLINELKEFVGRGLIATDLEEIFQTIIKRSRIMFEYRAQKKNKFSTKLKETLGKKWAQNDWKIGGNKMRLISLKWKTWTKRLKRVATFILLPTKTYSFNNYYYI